MEPIYLRGYRKRAARGFAALSIIPIGIDGFTQMLTSYESTHPVRLVTGAAFGIMLAILFSAMLSSRPNDYEGRPELVSLPAGARLARPLEEE